MKRLFKERFILCAVIALFGALEIKSSEEESVKIQAVTPQPQPIYVVANSEGPLHYVAVPIFPPGANASLLTPLKVTESGNVLFSHNPWGAWDTITQTFIGTPIAYRMVAGAFQTIHHSPSWQNAALELFFNEEMLEYYTRYTGQDFTITDMNDAGDVIGTIQTDFTHVTYNSPTGISSFTQPAIWPTGQSTAQKMGVIAPSRVPTGNINLYRLPPQNTPLFIADNGNIYGQFQDSGIHQIPFPNQDVHSGLLNWVSPASTPLLSEYSFPAAVSPNGSKQLTSDLLVASTWIYSINGLPTVMNSPSFSYPPARINDLGRFLTNGKWADGGLLPQSIPGLNSSIFSQGKALAINGKNELLGQKASGAYGIWTWHQLSVAQAGPSKGFYRERPTGFGCPPGWELQELVNSFTTSGYLLGIIRQTAQPEQTSPALFVAAALEVDDNNNGVIDHGKQADQATPEMPYRFWSNDDDDNPVPQPEPPAAPLAPIPDYTNEVVDGPGDLADFFPVFLDIKQLLTVLPPSTTPGATVKYKLKHADEKLNFVYTSLTRATAFDYQNAATATTGYGPNQDKAAHEAPTHQITATGIDIFELDPDLVNRIKDNDQGVILLEMHGMTAAPLKLVVEKDNVQIAEVAVNIATGEIKWESYYPESPVEDFKIPAYYATYAVKDLTWLNGKRYFPEMGTASADGYRTRIKVKIRMAGAGGKIVKLKVFDVDDPTPADWDPSNIVDLNDTGGSGGNDNRNGISLFGGTFAESSVDIDTTILDASGEATVEFIATHAPGDNYRIAAELSDGAGQLDALQVTNSTASKYVSSGDKPVRNFGGVASPTLTVWRKLHLEVDSMEAIPNPSANSSTGVAESYAPETPVSGQSQLQTDTTFGKNTNYFGGGRMNFGTGEMYVLGNSGFTISDDYVNVFPPEIYPYSTISNPQSLVNQLFTLTDDDDSFLMETDMNHQLPAHGLSSQLIEAIAVKYAPAYIQPINANALGLNPNPTIPFGLNEHNPGGLLPSVFNDAKDIEGTEYFWAFTVTFGYQPATGDDGDPNSQGIALGWTGKFFNPIYFTGQGFSAVYVETVRDRAWEATGQNINYLYHPDLFSSPSEKTVRAKIYHDLLWGAVAHEIGHGCGGKFDEHSEGGLMRAAPSEIDEHDFSDETLVRLRSIKEWK